MPNFEKKFPKLYSEIRQTSATYRRTLAELESLEQCRSVQLGEDFRGLASGSTAGRFETDAIGIGEKALGIGE